jgi:uncharacterized membrane protein
MESLNVITIFFAIFAIGAGVFGFLAVAEGKRTAPMILSRLYFGLMMGISCWVTCISLLSWFLNKESSFALAILAIGVTWFTRSYIHFSIKEDEKHKTLQQVVVSPKAVAE